MGNKATVGLALLAVVSGGALAQPSAALYGIIDVGVQWNKQYAAESNQRIGCTGTEPAARDVGHGDIVASGRQIDLLQIIGNGPWIRRDDIAEFIEIVPTVRVGAENLADLEIVVAETAVESRDCAVVVDDELIVTAAAADEQS